jgi:hypothetical protein
MQSGIIRFIDKGPLTSGRWYLLGLGATPRLMRECLNEVIPASGGSSSMCSCAWSRSGFAMKWAQPQRTSQLHQATACPSASLPPFVPAPLERRLSSLPRRTSSAPLPRTGATSFFFTHAPQTCLAQTPPVQMHNSRLGHCQKLSPDPPKRRHRDFQPRWKSRDVSGPVTTFRYHPPVQIEAVKPLTDLYTGA